MHYGAVDGITLDEAISTFKDAVDQIPSALHHVTDQFSSSSSTTQNIRFSTIQQSWCLWFCRGRLSTAATIVVDPSGVTALHTASSTSAVVSTFTSKTLNALSKPGGIVTNNHAETFTQSTTVPNTDIISSKSSSASLKTVSVVGGAVAVAASVAIIVSAWSQFSEASKRRRQATAVRDMPGNCLVLLLQDRKRVQQRQSRTPSIQLLQESKARQIKAFAVASTPIHSEYANSGDHSLYLDKDAYQGIYELTKQDQEQDRDDSLIEKFFNCVTDDENAAVEAVAEEAFMLSLSKMLIHILPRNARNFVICMAYKRFV
ncbi:unnamed protein product [Peronospora belbahrii]|uniref:Uncharacterized protein n=1 Tax=Peronospora belbahrii TaxID=622444 RepID=A0ABN8CYZ5_9STRA|nr:unnamed protein product [Peronospora belbahrii]